MSKIGSAICVAATVLTGGLFAGEPLAPYIADGVLTVPASTEIAVDNDNVGEFADVTSIVFAAKTAKLTFTNTDPLALAQPLSGNGVFSVLTGGRVTISGDNSSFSGEFKFSGCESGVTSANGLGAAGVKVTVEKGSGSSNYPFLLSGDGLTNSAAMVLGDYVRLTPENSADRVVLNGPQMTSVVGSPNIRVANMTSVNGFKPNGGSPILFLDGGAASTFGRLYTGGNMNFFNGGGDTTKPHVITLTAGNNRFDGVMDIASRVRVVCAATNCLRSTDGASSRTVFDDITSNEACKRLIDLNGYDQTLRAVVLKNFAASASGTSHDDFVSSKPATLRIDNIRSTANAVLTSLDVPFRFRGAVNFTCNIPSGATLGLAHAISDTTGTLHVASGSLDLKWKGAWGGEKVVLSSGGNLYMNSTNPLTNKNVRLEVSSGTVVLNQDTSVKSCLLGTTELPSGPHTSADYPDFLSGEQSLYVDYTPGQIVYTTNVWTGAVDGDLSKPGNWSGSKAPNLTDGGATLVFGPAANAPAISGEIQVYGLRFELADNYALDGSGTIKLGDGGIVAIKTPTERTS